MAAVPSIGRATRVEGADAPEAELTRSLYERYANQIFRYCLHQLGSREEAEDAVQSTFLNAFRGIRRGVVPELESAWLFKIAHNVCLSRRRSSWRRGRIESPADFGLVEDLMPAPSRRADELIGLQDVLAELPESQRRAILLREWQGLSYREIAEELELSQAAVETLIFRARRSLAQGLEEPRERRRIARGLDLGGLAAGLKSALFGGAVAAKVAATVAVVGATAVVAGAPLVRHHHAAPAPAHVAPAVTRAPAPSQAAPVRFGPLAPPVRPARPAFSSVRAVAPRHAPPRHGRTVHAAAPAAAAPPAPALAAPPPSASAPPAEHGRPAATSHPAHPAPTHPSPAHPAKSVPVHGEQRPSGQDPAQHGQGRHGQPAPGRSRGNPQPPGQADAPAAQPDTTPPGQAKKDDAGPPADDPAPAADAAEPPAAADNGAANAAANGKPAQHGQ